jgi:hypothetical protein
MTGAGLAGTVGLPSQGKKGKEKRRKGPSPGEGEKNNGPVWGRVTGFRPRKKIVKELI